MVVHVVVLQHACHFVKGCIFLVERLVGLPSPHFCQQPFAGCQTTVLVVFLILVGLLQKQDADCQSQYNDQGANNIWQKKRVRFEDSVLESIRRQRGLCEDTAKGAANDGAVKKRSVGCSNVVLREILTQDTTQRA